MTQQWMSIVDYARKFMMSDMTVRRRIRAGKLKAMLRNGKYYIDISQSSAIDMVEPASFDYRENLVEEDVIQKPTHIQTHKEVIPAQITQNIVRNRECTTDTKALLDFCEQTISKTISVGEHHEKILRNDIELLTHRLREEELHRIKLQQQVEDLQMLVKMLEQKDRPLQIAV